jgi:hypothetical protein
VPELIISFKNLIESEQFCNRHKKNPEDFTRKRSLPFHKLIYFFVNMPQAAYEAELCRFNKELHRLDIAEPIATKSALTKAREKLEPSAFIELNSHMVNQYHRLFAPKKWHEFYLLATDGTLAGIPSAEAVAQHFGQWNGRQGSPCPKARVSQLFDVLNQITVDALIVPKAIGERQLAAAHCMHVNEKDLLLLDRGYEAFWLFKLIRSSGAQFCARVSVNKLNQVKSFIKSGDLERTIKLPCSYNSARQCAHYHLDKNPIKLRLIRIDLPSGETEVLITSLTNRHKYSYEAFKELYHLRWPVEEDYKLIKCRIQVENFSGKTVHSVYQDFHAKVFAKNLASILIRSAGKRIDDITEGRRYRYKANFTNALSIVRNHIVVLFNRSKDLLCDYLIKIKDLVVRALSEIRPDRTNPRSFKNKSRNKYHTAYKPIS